MFQHLLERIALAFEARGIPYMLIGGQAVLLYGDPRLTKDVDVTLGIGPERLNDVLCLVEDLGWKVLVEDPRSFVEQTMVLPCGDPGTEIRVDLIFSTSRYEQQAIGRARLVAVGPAQVRFASVEDLIIHKMVAGRARDLEDVRSLLIRNSDADVQYIRRWLEQFDEALSESLSRRFQQLWNESQ
jgi:predicted nucleotidyltransferase